MSEAESFLACLVSGLKLEKNRSLFDDESMKMDAVDGGHMFADSGFDAFADSGIGEGALSRSLWGVVVADEPFAVWTLAF